MFENTITLICFRLNLFAYDAQGRITVQRRGANVNNKSGGEYVYYSGTNKLKSVANGMGGTTADKRDMSASDNFEYDAEGNMTKDYSKDMTIAYDWRGMPVEFKRQNSCYDIHEKIVCDSTKLEIKYDGSGRRISKTRLRRDLGASDWAVENVTHYTGIGTEVRETHVNGQDETKVVVNMPQGLGRYMPEDAVDGLNGVSGSQLAGYRPPAKFEWYLKNHIGSTMLVYGTSAYNDPFNSGYKDGVKAAYDYRAFGEQVDLTEPTDKVTENFTGKEKDDETELNYFGARYLDPMLGLWTSVDPARQFSSPYLYAGNGYNPVNGVDPSGSFYDDGERCSEFDPLVNNGSVSPSELDHLVKVSQNLQSSPGVENTIMSLAKYSYFNDVETSFWYDNEGQNTFNYGTRTDVKPLGGHGNYFHFHTWRSVNSWAYEGLTYVITSDGKAEGDIPWANQYEKSTMGLEVRSGKLFYYSPKLNKNYQYIIGRYPTWDIDAYQNVQDFDRSLFPQKN